MTITQTLRCVLAVVLLVLVSSLLGACATAPAPAQTPYTVVTNGELDAGEPIPLPTGEPLLTITGNIGADRANSDGAILMDLAALESVGLVDYTVDDPFENRPITYRGVLMSELLALWGVPDSATTLHMVALNDYAVDVPIDHIRQYPLIMALQADGEYMPIAEKGPAMIVYPYNHFEFDRNAYNDFWIWQLASIEVQ